MEMPEKLYHNATYSAAVPLQCQQFTSSIIIIIISSTRSIYGKMAWFGQYCARFVVLRRRHGKC